MKINQIVIHNFRGLLEETFSFCDYTLLVGANNAGKSTVIDALRAFYEKDGFKFKAVNDFPFVPVQDKESWIEVSFILSDDEYSSLADDYKTDHNILKVRKYFQTTTKMHDKKSAAGYIFGYRTDGTISPEPFYGAKNVQSGKFGDIVYIPAVSKVDEHTKLSGPSALRDLITNVLQEVVEASPSYETFNTDFANFADGIMTESTDDGRSLEGFQKDLNDLLGSWNTTFKLKLSAPTSAEIIKSMLSYDFFDTAHDRAQGADQFGSGFQRHFIFSLIQLGARYLGKVKLKKSKDFTPAMTLLLFEEPEAFLHPPQQDILARSLMGLSGTSDRQVVCSTHSPHFVSKNAMNIPSLIRMDRSAGHVRAFQISQETWQDIINANQAINAIAAKYPKLAARLESDDHLPEMEAVKHFLWLNPDRCGLFFANHVLLVEGTTEQAFINNLIGDGKINDANCGIYVLDCMGKFNMHRFMNLLSNLGIPHSVLHDDDHSKQGHAEINTLIQDSRHQGLTTAINTVRGDIEHLLGVPLPGANHRKPQHLLLLYEKGQIDAKKIDTFCVLVGACLPKNHG